jgi:hypothetical protein
MYAALAGLPLTIGPVMAQNETPVRGNNQQRSGPTMEQTFHGTPRHPSSASPENAGGGAGAGGGESGGSGGK